MKGLRANRHYTHMKVLLCLPLVFGSIAYADEALDRVAIERTIAALNDRPLRAGLFSEDADAAFELTRLSDLRPYPTSIPTGHPTITISHEPWGEATINFTGLVFFPGLLWIRPRIVCGAIRFITSDVALAEGTSSYENGVTTQITRLLFVMKEEGDNWKIASLRVLARP